MDNKDFQKSGVFFILAAIISYFLDYLSRSIQYNARLIGRAEIVSFPKIELINITIISICLIIGIIFLILSHIFKK